MGNVLKKQSTDQRADKHLSLIMNKYNVTESAGKSSVQRKEV